MRNSNELSLTLMNSNSDFQSPLASHSLPQHTLCIQPPSHIKTTLNMTVSHTVQSND